MVPAKTGVGVRPSYDRFAEGNVGRIAAGADAAEKGGVGVDDARACTGCGHFLSGPSSPRNREAVVVVDVVRQSDMDRRYFHIYATPRSPLQGRGTVHIYASPLTTLQGYVTARIDRAAT